MAAILADATNLGLGRMAESSHGVTHARLIWTAQWHIRDETYAAALAAIVDYHHVLPHSSIWGPGTGSSSDGQFYRAGAKVEGCADYNAKYGSDSGVLFYTHVSDRYAPFFNKVIAAKAGEAAHVIDGLLNLRASWRSRSMQPIPPGLSIMCSGSAICLGFGSLRVSATSASGGYIRLRLTPNSPRLIN